MILVADSGSTKADWKLAHNGSIIGEYSTMGFNPFFHNEKIIINALSTNEGLSEAKEKVKKVFFFGAGCSSDERNMIIADALKKFFNNASVLVEHDIMASVLATCGDDPGIAAILGTGSNSCYFDGKKIYHNNYGLGYILGDEGSGSYFGKKLLTLYLYGLMPEELAKDFDKQFEMNKEILIDHVYNKPNANVWLASWCKYCSSLQDHPWMNNIIRTGLEEFFNLYVCHLPDFQKVKVHFVGSIAHYFEKILHEVASSKGITIGKVIKQPIHSLAEYYLAKEKVA